MSEPSTSLIPPPPLAQVSDDASSVGSLPYFHSSDFEESSWTNTVGYYGVPSIGLAVLALFHPIFFLAGAGVAAASYGLYGFCNKEGKGTKETLIVEPFLVEKSKPAVLPAPCREVASLGSFHAPTMCTESESLNHNPLKNVILANESFVGLTAAEFFNVFLGNHAVFSFSEFQRRRGDINIEYTDWIGHQRVLKFETPTKQIFGPAYAVARKDQQLHRNSKHCVVMNSTTTLEKIPFCNTFCVREQWKMMSERDAEGKPTTILSITAQVDFFSRNPFEGQIKSKTMSTMLEVLGCWCKLAHEALRLTQQRAEERKKRQELETARDENAIEVFYHDRLQTVSIIGDDEANDWEMDPMRSPPKCIRTGRKLSFQAVRRSLSSKFLKNPGSTV